MKFALFQAIFCGLDGVRCLFSYSYEFSLAQIHRSRCREGLNPCEQHSMVSIFPGKGFLLRLASFDRQIQALLFGISTGFVNLFKQNLESYALFTGGFRIHQPILSTA